jgi:hypothetical protein
MALVNGKNSRFISILPENGSTFTELQKITLEIDESVGYIKGRDTYITVDIQNTTADNTRWCLPNGVGSVALIQQMDIYSKRTAVLLESLTNYNQMMGVLNQYGTDDPTVSQRLYGVGKPTNQWQNNGAVFVNPEDVENNLISPVSTTATLANGTYQPRQLIIPLKCGIFSSWNDTETVCPVLNFGGLRIDIWLAPNKLVCQEMTAYGRLETDLANKIPQTVIPLLSIEANTQTFTTNLNTGGLGVYWETSNSFNLVAGQRVVVTGQVEGVGALQTRYMTIGQIEATGEAGQFNIVFTTVSTFDDLAVGQPLENIQIQALHYPDEQASELRYTLSNVELHVPVMVLPKDAMSQLAKPMKYEMLTYDQFIDNILASERNHQTQINSVASKAKAIMSVFTPSENDVTAQSIGYYRGLRPSELLLNSVQYFINNKNYPMQAYNPREKEDKPQTFNELVKAFNACNLPCVNLGSNEKDNLNNYSNTFVVARELARAAFVFDLHNAEPELKMGFSNTRPQNVRVYTYVWSHKIVDVSANGLAVIL